jgi:hypothetical protein
MYKLFAGKPPATKLNVDNSTIPSSVLSILRSGSLAAVAGIEGVDVGRRPAGWTLEANVENIVFDSRFKYLRKLLIVNSTAVTLPARGATAAIAYYSLGSVVSNSSSSFILGKEINSPNYGIYTNMCNAAATRFVFFSSIVTPIGNLYTHELFLIEQYAGISAPSTTLQVTAMLLSGG